MFRAHVNKLGLNIPEGVEIQVRGEEDEASEVIE